jgi:hypothetical protein
MVGCQKNEKEAAMEPIASFLKSGNLARKQSYKNLTVFPLLAAAGSKPDYLTLEKSAGSKSCIDHRVGSSLQRSET